jgi:hypothetical protein
MIEATGIYKEIADRQVLVVSLDKKYFDKLRNHIVNSMFFSYCRSYKFDEITLSSIGDHLDKKDVQDLRKADIAINVNVTPLPTKEQVNGLNDWHSWAVLAICGNESLVFCIDKETEFIKDRDYTHVK